MRRDWTPWALGAGLVFISLAVYVQVVRFEFVNYDDNTYVTANAHVRQGLTWENVAWAFTSTEASNWHPVTWLSHMLDVQVFNLLSGAHHLVNAAIHALNAALLFLVLRRMTDALWPSAVVAALFAVHPLHVESVAWVAERKDVLSTLFGLLALWAYVSYVRQPGLARYALVFVLLALGLMAKPMLVTFPFLLLLLDYWPLGRLEQAPAVELPRAPPRDPNASRRESRKEQRQRTKEVSPPSVWQVAAGLVREKLPLLALAIASSVVTFVVQQQSGAMSLMDKVPLGPRIENALVAYVRYIGKTLWPVNLAVLYPFDPDQQLGPAVLAGLFLLAVTAAVIWAARRGRRYLAVGWCWFLGTLVPVIGLVQVGEQALADRYMYLPATGLFIMAVWAAADLLAERPFEWVVVAAVGTVAVVGACLLLTASQLEHWSDSETLLQRAIAVSPDNCTARNNLAAFYCARQDYDSAIEQCEEVLAIRPGDPTALMHLAAVCIGQKEWKEAEKHLQTALAASPDHHLAHYHYSAVLGKKGDLDGAVRHAEKAARLKPDWPEARDLLAQFCQAAGKWDEAERQWREVLRLDPNHPLATARLGMILLRQKKGPEALDLLQQRVDAKPEDVAARAGLAMAMGVQGNSTEAAWQWREVLQLAPRHPEAGRELGAILLRQGKVDDAISLLQPHVAHWPSDAGARHALAAALHAKGQVKDALAQWREILRIAPNDLLALNAVAWTLATSPDASLRNGPEAVRLAQTAQRLAKGDSPQLLDTLAAAHAEAGQFREAIETEDLAEMMAKRLGQKELAQRIHARLELYRAKSPFREAPATAGK
jgi:tetratricopeptide (TPR) repeat protein